MRQNSVTKSSPLLPSPLSFFPPFFPFCLLGIVNFLPFLSARYRYVETTSHLCDDSSQSTWAPSFKEQSALLTRLSAIYSFTDPFMKCCSALHIVTLFYSLLRSYEMPSSVHFGFKAAFVPGLAAGDWGTRPDGR